MTSLHALQAFGLAAFAVGAVVAFFAHRAPMRGWVGVTLLVIAAAAWGLIESGESSQPSSLPMFVTFMVVAPVAIVYSLRARRTAPDRAIAFAAFLGAFVVATFLILMLVGIFHSMLLT
jgi:FtsH-binding integral membrane protein